MGRTIEAELGSPSDRDDFAVFFYHTSGGQRGELKYSRGRFVIEIYPTGNRPLILDAEVLVAAVQTSLDGLKPYVMGT